MSRNALSTPTSNHIRRKLPRKRSANPYLEQIVNQPLDMETFLFVARVFDAAGRGTMPCDMSSLHPVFIGGYEVRLTDKPLNRGIVAATRELKNLNLPLLQQRAYVWRVMHIGAVFDLVDKSDGLVTRAPPGKEVLVAEALIRAFAVAKYDVKGDDAKVNIDSLLAHAKRFREAET